ncbi:hypothetical protein D3C77_119580 [compost metagenome]
MFVLQMIALGRSPAATSDRIRAALKRFSPEGLSFSQLMIGHTFGPKAGPYKPLVMRRVGFVVCRLKALTLKGMVGHSVARRVVL